MKIFGKSLSEYVKLQKVILGLILVVGIARLALSLGGVPDATARWLSVSVVLLIGLIYYPIKVHTSGFGSYKHLLPLYVIQNTVATAIIATGILIAILTHKDNIFSVPEYSGGQDGKTWIHIAAHVIFGIGLFSLLGWAIGSLILLISRKVAPRNRSNAAGA